MKTTRWLCAAALILSCRLASASGDLGTISGTIFEPGGDPAPLANVTLVHQESGLRRELIANQQGQFDGTDLPGGAYSLAATSLHSRASKGVTVVLRPGQKVDLPITLETAAESNALRDLPLNGRNYLDVIRDASEVIPGPEGSGSLHSNGQPARDNNFLIDGMDNNENWVRGAILEPSIESTYDASLITTYIPADLGHATGAIVTVETRSGGNQFHGSGFEYFQTSALDASNFFDRGVKPGLLQNQFGGRVGGPLRKNDWFFFADAELSRQRQGLTVVSTVPTAAQKLGDFGSVPIYDPMSITEVSPGVFVRQPVPDNRIPLSLTPLPSRSLIGLYPNPNLPGVADNYLFTPSLLRNGNRFDARSDKILSARSTLFARFSYGSVDSQNPGAMPAVAGADSNLNTWSGVIAHTFVLRPTLINEIRAGISRFDLNAYAQDRGLKAAAALGIPGLGSDGLPVISPSGFSQLGAPGPAPAQIRDTNHQLEDTVTWTTARHIWKFGAQTIRRHSDGSAGPWTDRGTFLFTPDYTSQPGVQNTGDSIASLLFGYPSEIRRDSQFAPYQLRGWEWSGFVQDEIRLWRRLTIQAGIRYSLCPPVTEANNRMANFNFARHAPAVDQFAGVNGVNSYAGLDYNKGAIAPRIGIAWDVFGNGFTVLRGGFSKAYDAGAYIAEGILARNPPYASRQDIYNGTLLVGPNLTDGLPAPQSIELTDSAKLDAAGGSIYALEPRGFTPYSDQWGVFVEQRLRPSLTLEIGGTSSMGIHLYDSYDINQAIPAPTPFIARRYSWFAPDTSHIEYLGFAGGSTYYGGHFKLTGRFKSGLQFMASYSYSKSLTDSNPAFSDNESRPSGPQDLDFVRGIRSVAPFDITQRMVATAFYELPFKWRASAVVTIQGGTPFTPQLATNGLNNGGFQLPNRVADGALPSDQRSYLHWFDTSAFVTPALYQYGNSGFDILRGPGLATVDASLGRSFPLSERLTLQLRGEAFNLLNRTNLALPNRILDVESSGVISHTSTPSRQLQLVARVEW